LIKKFCCSSLEQTIDIESKSLVLFNTARDKALKLICYGIPN